MVRFDRPTPPDLPSARHSAGASRTAETYLVLTSQRLHPPRPGCEVHGIFVDYDDAIAHIAKDMGWPCMPSWQRHGDSMRSLTLEGRNGEIFYWCCSEQPLRDGSEVQSPPGGTLDAFLADKVEVDAIDISTHLRAKGHDVSAKRVSVMLAQRGWQRRRTNSGGFAYRRNPATVADKRYCPRHLNADDFDPQPQPSILDRIEHRLRAGWAARRRAGQ